MSRADLPAKLRGFLDALALLADRAERINFLIDVADRFREVPPEIAARPFPPEHEVQHCESGAFVWARRGGEGFELYFAVENPQGISARALAVILSEGLAGSSLEEILAALEAEQSAWAEETLAALRKCSPTSLKVAFRQLRAGDGLDFEAAMIMEYRLSQACVAGHDFPEGIRAAVIDKDRAPKWRPASLAEVGEELVAAHFAPPADGDLAFS